MQYGLAATLIQAVDDFLTGPSVLRRRIGHGRGGDPADPGRVPGDGDAPGLVGRGDFREMQVVRAPNEPGHEVLTWFKRAAYLLPTARRTRRAWWWPATRTGGTSRRSAAPS